MTSEYVLGAGGAEQQRLIRQAHAFRAEAAWLLDQICPEPGWRVVDVGCGPLGILDLLADRVGAHGEIVGVDNEARMIEMARAVITQLSLANVTLLEADAMHTGLERSSFDLVHARLLLVNVAEPQRIVIELSALTRLGGIVALEEVDWISWICEPPHPAWDRLRDVLREFRHRRGLDVYLGRRLPGLLRGAGLEVMGFRALCPTYTHGADNHSLLVGFANIHGPDLIRDGLVGADELAGLVNDLDAHLAHPETMTMYSLFCQAWARRPITSDTGRRRTHSHQLKAPSAHPHATSPPERATYLRPTGQVVRSQRCRLYRRFRSRGGRASSGMVELIWSFAPWLVFLVVDRFATLQDAVACAVAAALIVLGRALLHHHVHLLDIASTVYFFALLILVQAVDTTARK